MKRGILIVIPVAIDAVKGLSILSYRCGKVSLGGMAIGTGETLMVGRIKILPANHLVITLLRLHLCRIPGCKVYLNSMTSEAFLILTKGSLCNNGINCICITGGRIQTISIENQVQGE
jgi:hypothetical protein